MARKAAVKRKATRKSPEPPNAATTSARPTANAAGKQRVLNTRPDGIDFRDQMYVPTLIEVPIRRD